MSRESIAIGRMALWLVEATVARAKAGPAGEALAAEAKEVRRLISESTEQGRVAQRELERLILEMRQVLDDGDVAEGREAERAPESKLGDACSIEVVDSDPGPCVSCGWVVGEGIVGWRRRPDAGPLCDRCLGSENVDLGAAITVYQRLRELAFETGRSLEQDEATTGMLELASDFAHATAGAWPSRSVGTVSQLENVLEMMEERHGMLWLSELERLRGGREPN